MCIFFLLPPPPAAASVSEFFRCFFTSRTNPFRAPEAVCYLLMSHLVVHQLQHLKLGAELQPRTRLPTMLRLLTAPIGGLGSFRLCPLSAVCCWRFALAGLGDARAADAVIFVVIINHAAVNAVKPPATPSLAAAAMRVLRRCVWLSAQFTIRTLHGTPLRRAVRVCSSAYHIPYFSVWSLSSA